MRTKLIAFTLVLPLCGAAMLSAARAEEYRGTWEQQMACTGDVWRFCGDQIPDVNRIVACLQQNEPNLSSGCRAVFQSNNSMPRSQTAPSQRGRTAPPSASHGAPPSSSSNGEKLD